MRAQSLPLQRLRPSVRLRTGLLAGCLAASSLVCPGAAPVETQSTRPAAPSATDTSRSAPAAPVPAQPPAAPAKTAQPLFDGKTLGSWKPASFSTQAKVAVVPDFRDGRAAIVAETSDYLSGITWSDPAPLPLSNYEIALDAIKLDGDDFFCGLTFPIGDAHCTLVVGGWGGMVVGLSNVDFMDASENATTSGRKLAANRWYRIRLRVTEARVEAWIDQDKVVDIERAGRTFSLRQGEIRCSAPLGLSAFQVKAAWRDITLTRL